MSAAWLLAAARIVSLAVLILSRPTLGAETESLPRVPPRSPQEALATFQIAPGFRIELVAAEPLVMDPVAMAFDEQGALFVVEMRDYSEQDQEHLGRIRRLTDRDGDGTFDVSRIFAEDLSWPTAIACYDGGVLVGNAPDILYLKDTDQDGVADLRQKVVTGFGRDNVQGLLNSFLWSLDNRLLGATSSNGGKISPVGAEREPLDLHGRDFALEPRTFAIEAMTGSGQHGMTLNPWGDRFVCHNSDHLRAVVLEESYLARNPFQSVAGACRSIAADGPQAEVYRISPVEAWRVARTKMRVEGRAPGPIEGGGRAAGYFTSATGVTVYTGGLWQNDDPLHVYIADVGSNLIHRKKLIPAGVTYRGERIDPQGEFLRSPDIWFRPVQMAIGPDGGLYVADMYREVIEHPASLPEPLKAQLDLTSGNDRGRIYRIVPQDYHYQAPPALQSATTADLVRALDHENMWRRTTASRLLYERQDPQTADLLRDQWRKSTRPECRVCILYALEDTGAMTVGDVLAGLNDAGPQVRRHALRLAESFLGSSEEVRRRVFAMANDRDLRVQFQLALSVGESGDIRTPRTLAQLLMRHADNPDIVSAAMTSMANCAGEVLAELRGTQAWYRTDQARPILRAIVNQIVRQRRAADLAILVPFAQSAGMTTDGQLLADLPESALRGDGPQLAELRACRAKAVRARAAAARQRLACGTLTPQQRVAAVEDLRFGPFDEQVSLLDDLLAHPQPASVHAAILRSLAQRHESGVADFVLDHWQLWNAAEQLQAIDLLLARNAWTMALLRRMSAEPPGTIVLQPRHLARLKSYPSDDVKEFASRVLSATDKSPAPSWTEYRQATLAGGDADHGKKVFEQHCATCHAIGGSTSSIGPNLTSIASRGLDSVLQNILEPSREVDSRYLEYTVVTVDGHVLSGIIMAETATSVTVVDPNQKQSTVLRADIEEMRSTGKSMMPDGFGTIIDLPAMADLMSYLAKSGAVRMETEGGK